MSQSPRVVWGKILTWQTAQTITRRIQTQVQAAALTDPKFLQILPTVLSFILYEKSFIPCFYMHSKYHLVDTLKIKTITGSDRITVQKKHEDPFEMLAFAKLIFSTNCFSQIYDQTEGFLRRWIIIEWKRSFTKIEIVSLMEIDYMVLCLGTR